MCVRLLWVPCLAALLLAGRPAAATEPQANAADAQALAKKIDQLLERRWADTKAELAPPADDAEGHVECEGPAGVRIMFDTVSVIHSFDPDWKAPVGGPAMSLAFECTDPAEVDQTVADVLQAGFDVHREPWDAFWGQRYATLHDPDGNPVDLFAPRPGSS